MGSGTDLHGVSKETARKGPPSLRSTGDSLSAGFDTIYDDHAPLLRAIARRKFNVPDSDIDGLVHDVFTSFLTSASRVRELRPYLVGGICNASRNYWRRRERDDSLFVEIDEDAVCGADLQQSVSRNLTLNAALSRIGDRCRNVLQRYYLESESTSTIAEAIGTSPGNVLYILHTCRKRAREFLDQLHPKR
jgi:RNA polymerase sigma factor (sigma-70 family)